MLEVEGGEEGRLSMAPNKNSTGSRCSSRAAIRVATRARIRTATRADRKGTAKKRKNDVVSRQQQPKRPCFHASCFHIPSFSSFSSSTRGLKAARFIRRWQPSGSLLRLEIRKRKEKELVCFSSQNLDSFLHFPPNFFQISSKSHHTNVGPLSPPSICPSGCKITLCGGLLPPPSLPPSSCSIIARFT